MMVGHPVRVAAPQGELVSLGVLKDHLGVVGAHDDARIAALLAAAVAHLDGWRGALGRCILTQSWRVDYDDEGTHLLPFPDVSTVTAVDATGAAVTAVLSQGARGSYVKLEGPATVTAASDMPPAGDDEPQPIESVVPRACRDLIADLEMSATFSWASKGPLLVPSRSEGPLHGSQTLKKCSMCGHICNRPKS